MTSSEWTINPATRVPRDNIIACARTLIDYCKYEPEDTAELYFAFNLMHRCGRQLTALIALEEAGCLDSADSLARAIFENAVTGVWVIESPVDRNEKVTRAFRQHVSLCAKDGPEHYLVLLAAIDRWMDQEYGDHGEARLDPVEQRLPEVLRPHYLWYRETSGRQHASIIASLVGQEDPSKHQYEQGYLQYSAFLTAGLATMLHAKAENPASRAVAMMWQFFAAVVDGKI